MLSEGIDFVFHFSEHLIATQCVVRHFSEVVGVQCDYEAINTAIWERNNLFNIIDMLIATEFPGTECAGRFIFL